MSNHVFVLDANRQPLTPCNPRVARSLLKAGKAAVLRRYPFTIILKKQVEADPEPIELKLDPGSKVTGIALKQGNQIIFGAELQHRGQQIKAALLSRRQLRRSRRNRKTRYRQARFLNRTRPDGWLPPSLQHRNRSRVQIHKGFQTGDIVAAIVTAGKKIGCYVGRVLCRASGSFDIATASGRVAGISHKYCKSIHRKDGYSYA